MDFVAALLVFAMTSAAAPVSGVAPPAPIAAAPSSDFDFDLLPPPPPPSVLDLDRAQAVKTRRTMLQVHQILGLSTLALMTATVILGHFNYDDIYGQGGGRTGRYLRPKRILAYTTTGAFAATASFSLLAPTPYPKVSQGIDTAVVHKVANGVAAAGMVTQIVLGLVTARSADAGDGRHLNGLMRAHQVVGYVTLASLATATVAWVF